jgi:hypothetical protein
LFFILLAALFVIGLTYKLLNLFDKPSAPSVPGFSLDDPAVQYR